MARRSAISAIIFVVDVVTGFSANRGTAVLAKRTPFHDAGANIRGAGLRGNVHTGNAAARQLVK
jgi:hypothetical protein